MPLPAYMVPKDPSLNRVKGLKERGHFDPLLRFYLDKSKTSGIFQQNCSYFQSITKDVWRDKKNLEYFLVFWEERTLKKGQNLA